MGETQLESIVGILRKGYQGPVYSYAIIGSGGIAQFFADRLVSGLSLDLNVPVKEIKIFGRKTGRAETLVDTINRPETDMDYGPIISAYSSEEISEQVETCDTVILAAEDAVTKEYLKWCKDNDVRHHRFVMGVGNAPMTHYLAHKLKHYKRQVIVATNDIECHSAIVGAVRLSDPLFTTGFAQVDPLRLARLLRMQAKQQDSANAQNIRFRVNEVLGAITIGDHSDPHPWLQRVSIGQEIFANLSDAEYNLRVQEAADYLRNFGIEQVVKGGNTACDTTTALLRELAAIASENKEKPISAAAPFVYKEKVIWITQPVIFVSGRAVPLHSSNPGGTTWLDDARETDKKKFYASADRISEFLKFHEGSFSTSDMIKIVQDYILKGAANLTKELEDKALKEAQRIVNYFEAEYSLEDYSNKKGQGDKKSKIASGFVPKRDSYPKISSVPKPGTGVSNSNFKTLKVNLGTRSLPLEQLALNARLMQAEGEKSVAMYDLSKAERIASFSLPGKFRDIHVGENFSLIAFDTKDHYRPQVLLPINNFTHQEGALLNLPRRFTSEEIDVSEGKLLLLDKENNKLDLYGTINHKRPYLSSAVSKSLSQFGHVYSATHNGDGTEQKFFLAQGDKVIVIDADSRKIAELSGREHMKLSSVDNWLFGATSNEIYRWDISKLNSQPQVFATRDSIFACDASGSVYTVAPGELMRSEPSGSLIKTSLPKVTIYGLDAINTGVFARVPEGLFYQPRDTSESQLLIGLLSGFNPVRSVVLNGKRDVT